MKKHYLVMYSLAYEGGGREWEKTYRTKMGAKIAMAWNLYIASWGGSASFYEKRA